MRAAARAAASALRRFQAKELTNSHLSLYETITTRAAAETLKDSRGRGGLGLLAAAAGAAAAACALSAPTPARAEAPWQSEKGAPDVPVDSRYARPAQVRGALPREVVIYQYDVCPFCCKVKAFLDYYKVPYRCVEVNPLTKAELRWSEYKKVPVVVVDGEQVNDSSAIISRLAAEIEAAGGKATPWLNGSASGGGAGGGSKKGWFGGLLGGGSRGSSKEGSAAASEEEETKWRRWVDDWLVRVITVNIYRTAGESLQTFDYISREGNFGWVSRQAARVVGATTMWGMSGRLRKKYGVEGDVREVLYKSADEWIDAVGDRRFLGGDAPNLADLAVFGVVRSVVGTDTFNDLMQNSRIGGWYERMFLAVGPSSRVS